MDIINLVNCGRFEEKIVINSDVFRLDAYSVLLIDILLSTEKPTLTKY